MTDPIVTAARFLAAQLPWLRHRPPAELAEFLADVDACHRRLTSLARGPADRRYLGPCGAPLVAIPPEPEGVHPANAALGLAPCDGEVYARSGADTGYCQACGTSYPVKERREWLDGLVAERAYRAVYIADAYDISADTIRSWARRGLLRSYWVTDAGLTAEWTDPPDGEKRERVHYVADVLALDRQARERKAEREARRTGDAA